jgi:hypothetical protein
VVAPISLASIARRLGLGSRTTSLQVSKESGQRSHFQPEQSDCAQSARRIKEDAVAAELKLLRKELNELRAYIARIAINAHRINAHGNPA